jgi:hypothetical protein
VNSKLGAVLLFSPVVLTIGALAATFTVFPSDIVTDRYVTLAEAREKKVFVRGWLPDILPPSTVGIRTSNNLDLSTSEGEFSFKAREWHSFERMLSQGSSEAPFENWPLAVSKYAADGYAPWHHVEGDTTWVFFCKSEVAYCEYIMWLTRKG